MVDVTLTEVEAGFIFTKLGLRLNLSMRAARTICRGGVTPCLVSAITPRT